MNTLQRTTCPLDCPDACGILAEVDPQGRLVRLRGDPEHGHSRGTLCGKTMLYPELVHAPHRVTQPLVKRNGQHVAVSWEEALDLVAAKTARVAPRDILALWYGGSMGLVQRKFPLRMMHALGAVFHDGGICDAAGQEGYAAVLGRCIGPELERIEDHDLVVLWGCDASRTVQHMQAPVRRMQARGVPVIVVDVWRTDTMKDVEARGGLGVVIQPGTDALLCLALARLAYESGRVDRAQLSHAALGSEQFEQHVCAGHDVVTAAETCRVESADIQRLADLLLAAKRPFVKSGVGWTRRRNGAMGMRALASLCVVLGQPDALHYESWEHFQLPEDWIMRPDLRPVDEPLRYTSQVGLGRTLEEGAFQVAFVWCHDPAVTIPDSARFRRGFARPDLFTVVHDQFMTETAQLADVVLPATNFLEHPDVYRSWGHRRMQRARAVVKGPNETRSNVQTFAALAQRMGLPKECWDVDEDALCDAFLEQCAGRLTPAELAAVRSGVSIQPHALAFADRGTPSGRLELHSSACAASGQPAMATWVPDDACGDRRRFWLVAAPSVHTHNATYSHSARHIAKAGKPRVHLNPDDLQDLQAVEGSRLRLANATGAISLPAVSDSSMPRGMVRVDGLPRACDVAESQGINALVSGQVSDMGGGNVQYSTMVDLTVV